MTAADLLLIAVHLISSPSALVRAREVAAEIASIESDEAVARSVFVWAYREGAWFSAPPGSSDNGGSCGVLQISAGQWTSVLPETWTCAAMREDRLLGLRAGILVLHHLRNACGSLSGAWSAYSSGRCRGAPLLVARRCVSAGLTARCEVKP